MRTLPAALCSLALCLPPCVVSIGCAGGPVAKAYLPEGRVEKFSNDDWQTVLTAVATTDGYVDYEKLTANTDGVRDALYRYVGQINQVSPENRPELFPTDDDDLAYYLNAYNALCMYGVLEKGLPGNVLLSGLYFTSSFPVGGESMSLDTLEKRHVRTAGDPRIHYALNCMSVSCPPLRREPYAGPQLDAQLADQARVYLSDERAVRVRDRDTVALNDIFTDYYKGEFVDHYAEASGTRDPGLIESLRPDAGPDSPLQTAKAYKSMGYDWSLNRPPGE